MESALRVVGISKRYGDFQALKDINFEVPIGSICGFIGPNGAGKTTLIRVLLGLIKPDNGEIEVLKKRNPKEYLSKVGAMIEGPAFYPALTGIANLKILAQLSGVPFSRANQILNTVGLTGDGKRKFKNYSLGMKQRLGVAAALLPNPEILILDEPTNGLDPSGIFEMRKLFRDFANQGKTIFISSHLLSELQSICDFTVMINNGEIRFVGRPDSVAVDGLLGEIEVEPEYKVDLNRLIGIIEKLGLKFENNLGKILIQIPAQMTAELNRLAFAEGITLQLIARRNNTLEEKFFEMVDIN